MTTSAFSTAFVRVPIAPHAIIQDIDWTRLTQLIQQPQFLEALYIASPALYDEAIKLDTSRLPDEKNKRVVYSLIKYLSRYGTRCTPFGLFGGFSTLPITNSATSVRIDPTVRIRKVIRLDMNYLCALAQDLEKHGAIRSFLRFFPNNSLYQINEQYRYVEYRYNEFGSRVHQLSSADFSAYLETVLERANTGATVHELAATLISDEISEEEADGFIEAMLAAQLLVSELEPALTGDNFLFQLIDALAAIHTRHPSEEVQDVLNLLRDVAVGLANVEESTDDTSTEKFTAIEEKLSQLPTPFDRKVLFQIDTYLPETEGQLNKGLLNKLMAKIPSLLKLTPTGHETLDTFRDKFFEKYEEEEVPLMIALDPEIGVGYPAGGQKSDASPLLDGISRFASTPESQNVTIPKEHHFLLRKLADAQLSGTYQIEITEDDLRQFEPVQATLPLTNTALFSVIREEGREKIILESFGGVTGTYFLGRFGHTDPSVLQLLREISQTEDQARPDVIFADIVHLPEARTGNVIIRPALKDYQIPFLGKASVDKEHEIPVNDLMISVRGNRIRLRSKTHNKLVAPRLSNAHNYANLDSLDTYHFLCDIQAQHEQRVICYVGGAYSHLFVFNPRITLDNLILSEAQWHFRDTHVKSLVTTFKQNNWPLLREALAQWRTQYRIPRYVSLVNFDNELYVDLENQWLAETFMNEIKSLDKFTIKEFLHRSDTSVVQSSAGWHTNQFVVAFNNTADVAVPNTSTPKPQPVTDNVARKFSLGSEWLYYKVYTGIKTADYLLTEVLNPITERFKAAGWVDKFFFIRYGDPHHHFRFRWHFTKPDRIGDVIHEVHEALAPFLQNKTVTSIVNDTYNRELERYGRHSIDTIESFFHADSQSILNFLSMIEGAEGEECRWRFGMKLMHDLLDQAGFDWKQRIAFTEQQSHYFGKEFGYNATQKKQLDARYKAIEPAIDELLNEANTEHEFLYDICHQRSEQVQPMIDYIQSLQEQGALSMSLENLLSSLIHMTVNRLFRSRQRFVEYSLYYHLHKHYRAVYGRTVLAKQSVTNVVQTC
ncbi:lantibiotic dehydratase [Spirosoma sp. BT702]|uniref:Lantibiotic dehydratase n=1 Tax=Spirosoma profusum TaxID=2771354 RepID=A0A926XTX3_9BACT|nr:lantibiotic dehydratase [Spirosoma profusum]MBD2699535.1 lantibiotic dehydratase [Spirosoma profusum]